MVVDKAGGCKILSLQDGEVKTLDCRNRSVKVKFIYIKI